MYIKIILELFVLGSFINESSGIKGQEYLLKLTVEHILRNNIGTDSTVLLLLSNFVEDKSGRFFNNINLPGTMDWLEDLTLKIIYENSLWPITTFHPKEELSIDVPLTGIRGYIIFINPKTENVEDILEGNLGQLEEKRSLNRHS